jgi:creatinine amidohydrolase
LIERFGAVNPGTQVVLATWWKLVSDSLYPLNETGPGGVGHAGEFETSLMLHIDPDMVKVEKIEELNNNSTFGWADGDMLRGPKASLYRSMKTMTDNGVFGDPGRSSTEKGKKITELVVDSLKIIVTDLYKSS